MKMLNYFFVLGATFFADVVINGLCGRPYLLTAFFVYAYGISFFLPSAACISGAFFVMMHAVFYQKATMIFWVTILGLLFLRPAFNKFLRQDWWVRGFFAIICFFIMLMVFYGTI